MAIEIGMKGSASALVEKEDTAQVVGSGDLLVYATPYMVALMEGAACECISGILEPGESSVGISMNVAHTSATPVGMEVRAEAEVTAVEGRKISFQIRAFDEAGEIGNAVHERFVIKAERFLEKAYGKL